MVFSFLNFGFSSGSFLADNANGVLSSFRATSCSVIRNNKRKVEIRLQTVMQYFLKIKKDVLCSQILKLFVIFFFQTKELKSGGLSWDVHFWLGSETSQVKKTNQKHPTSHIIPVI